MREGFVFYRSFAEAMEGLPAEEYKAVMVALCRYALNDESPDSLDPISNTIFTLIKPQLDANNRRYENGRKGGRPKKTEAEPSWNQTETKPEPNRNQTETKPEPKEKEKVKDKEKELSNESKKSLDPVLLAAVQDYENHRKKIKAPLTERALDLALKKLEELAPGDTPTKVAIINQSIMNGWKGLFALHENNRSPNDKHGITRDDDLDGRVMLQAAARLHNGIGVSVL